MNPTDRSPTTWLGRDRVAFEQCGSTNDEAARLAEEGARHGTIVTARAQSAGRGRHGRSWFSPTDENLYLSCLLRPTCAPSQAPPLTLAAGMGVVDAVNQLELRGDRSGDTPVRAILEWPNDVVIDGRKVAGVLTEMSTRGTQLEYVVVGIGVNLATRSFPPELEPLATSLYLAGLSVERTGFLESLLGHLEGWFNRFFARGSRALISAWMQRAEVAPGQLGRRVDATTEHGPIVGRITGLEVDGRLQVTDNDGRVHVVMAGVVEYRD